MPTVQPLGPRLYQQVEGKTIFRIVGPGAARPIVDPAVGDMERYEEALSECQAFAINIAELAF